MNDILLSTAYFPPILFFSAIKRAGNVYLECQENFTKQTFRNRCEILSPNGIQTLSVPIVKKSGSKQRIKDIKISYETDWQKDHQRAIMSAYGNSPFFEILFPDIKPLFNKKTDFLFDLNNEINNILLSYLNIEVTILETKEYEFDFDGDDYRYIVNEKNAGRKNNRFLKEYTQVFSEKYDFVPNLSVLDIIFNEGGNAFDLI